MDACGRYVWMFDCGMGCAEASGPHFSRKERARNGAPGCLVVLRQGRQGGSGLLHLVEHSDHFQRDGTHDLQTLWAELVDGILWRVPEDIVVTVFEID